ncbi:universal stress protein [Xenophilus arseniciresistens]|uniref:Universal stress protein n=1 Tax=Xenophilus arseniciresistens TaxID=1283306 RepID=A0AAE3N7X6_9BURK|nr:universal stress protein [Xenophilus arseniciresistens]MDA7414914.1 universal stress protein [Xenophilus arseniciresistens]
MSRQPQAPSRILFATDLSSRCDRALDRTVQLGQQWRASAVALSVIDPATAPQDLRRVGGPARAPLGVAEQRLRADLAVQELPFAVRVESGPVADAVLAVAEAERAGLIVTGVARNEALSRILLGSSVDTLARRASVPLLVVRNRVRAPYPRVRVATDLSDSAGHALCWALAAFPEAQVTLFHAFDTPPHLRHALGQGMALRNAHEAALQQMQAWLAALPLPEAQRTRPRMALETGDPAARLYEHSQQHPDELIVLGRAPRGALAQLLLGSVARQALDIVEADVVVVPHAAG